MTFKEVHEFIVSYRQSLLLEELLIDLYSKTLLEESTLRSLNSLEKDEIIQILNTLNNDSIRHKEAIEKLIEETKHYPQI